ncbi:MAG: ROK family protein [Acidimicrobiales bacterium]|jgi:glucokinase
MASSAAGAVVALDIGGTKIASAIGDADGELRRWRTLPTEAERGAKQVLESAIALAHEVLGEERANGGDVSAIGVSTMGLTRVDRVDLAPNVPGWEELAIPAVIHEAFPAIPAAFGNDVKLAALAELTWGALVGVSYGVYLNLGTGIAATLVVGGHVVEGAHGAAGEIGYWLTDGSSTSRMAADGAVPTEEVVGGRGVARRTAELFGREVEVVELVALAEVDQRAETLLRDVWDKIATLVANLAIVCDPEVLVLGGGYVRSDRFPIDAIARLVARAVPYSPEVVRARFAGDASLHGAVAVALRDGLGVASPRAGAGEGRNSSRGSLQ